MNNRTPRDYKEVSLSAFSSSKNSKLPTLFIVSKKLPDSVSPEDLSRLARSERNSNRSDEEICLIQFDNVLTPDFWFQGRGFDRGFELMIVTFPTMLNTPKSQC